MCGARSVVRNGKRGGVTRYRCMACGSSASSSRRPRLEAPFDTYLFKKQTRENLAEHTGLSTRTIARRLDAAPLPEKTHRPRPVVVVMDATYFGKKSGILVARDPNEHEHLHVHEIVSETKAEYQKARNDLESLGYTLQAVVLDGRQGIPAVFEGLPVQICQYHQQQIARRRLTLRPESAAGQELLSLAFTLARTDETTFRKSLEDWYRRYASFVNEKTHIEGTRRWRYTHRRVRSAYVSLLRNLPNLFTHQKYPELSIPNTTNSLDGSFNALKAHVNVHRGSRPDRRMKLVRRYLRL